MKKTFSFLLVLLFIFGCSADAVEDVICKDQVWGMNSRVTTNFAEYFVDYGPDEENTTTVEVNKATYDYYQAIVRDENPEDCWEGMK